MTRMVSPSNHSIHDPFLGDPSVEVAPPQAIHQCLELIWNQLHLRSRLFLRERKFLVLRDYVGTYHRCPEIGLKVHPGSIVWKIFQKGEPVNLTESSSEEERPHSLPEPVTIKAIIPLKLEDPQEGLWRTLGVLVVDAGDSPGPIENRDFQYLKVLGMLTSEILERTNLLFRIRKIQMDREKMAQEVAHIFRNRLLVIGGFARRLKKVHTDRMLMRWARIILEEVEMAERALERWRNSHEKRGMGLG